MNTITCSKCGNTIEINKALEEELRHRLEAESLIENEKVRRAMEEELTARLARKYELEEKKKQGEIEEDRKQIRDLSDQVILLTKQLRIQQDASAKLEREAQKKILEESEIIRKKAIEDEAERHRLKDKEKEMLIESLKKSLEEAQRKASQGSQQSQGEIQELDLEETLTQTFRDDDIEPVGKGVLGADVRQIVKSPRGLVCGKILWESKRTKAWSDGWIAKLKDDLLADKSHIPVIVSEALPEEAKNGIGQKGGVWIAHPRHTITIAMLLRKSLLDAAKQRVISEHKQTKAEELYSFVMSPEFIQQMEAMIETYRDMQKSLSDEKAAMERIWKKRDMQITRLLAGTGGIVGSMQGILGPALPTPKGLELGTIDDSHEAPKLI